MSFGQLNIIIIKICTSLDMGGGGQEYRSGLPLPSPGDLPDTGIELRSPAL